MKFYFRVVRILWILEIEQEELDWEWARKNDQKSDDIIEMSSDPVGLDGSL